MNEMNDGQNCAVENDRTANIPQAEIGLPSQMASLFVKVGTDTGDLEGLCFDRSGNLFFVGIQTGTIFQLEMATRKVSVLVNLGHGAKPCAVKIHRDGRFFVACVDSFDGGLVAVLEADGTYQRTIASGLGLAVDDLVFDQNGGFYLTDLNGSTAAPTGGVYYVPNDFGTVIPVIPGLNGANGIALNPEEDALWITEHGSGLLHRIRILADHVTIPISGSSIPYRFSGYEGPDSCCIDARGNLYVAMFRQGRYLVFNPLGVPVQQIIIPGRASGKMLLTTHPAIRPGTTDLFLTASDSLTHETAIYICKSLASAHLSYQFR